MKRILAVLFVAAALAGLATPALAADKHPPKFDVHGTQCTGDNNQPHCPGAH